MSEKTQKTVFFKKTVTTKAESGFLLSPPPPRSGISLSKILDFRDDTRFKRFFKAFSIVELMISLVIVSLVVAAFTPVITKKMNPALKGQSGSNKSEDDKRIEMLKAKYADMFMPYSAIANKTQTTKEGGYFKCNGYRTGSSSTGYSITCQIKIPSDHVSIVMVGAGGGGGNAGNGHFGTKTDANIVDGMRNGIISCNANNGIPAGSVFKTEDGPTEIEYLKECPEKTVEITTVTGSKFCVTKYNVRPSRYEDYHFNKVNPKTWFPENVATAKEIKADLPTGTLLRDSGGDSEYTYVLNNKSPVCWISNDKYFDNSDYSGNGRTVCNWYAANLLCPALDLGGNNCSDDGIHFDKPCQGRWRLMSIDEAKKGDSYGYAGYNIKTHIYSILSHDDYEWHPNNTKNALNINSSGSSSYCPGSANGTCYMYNHALESYNDTKAYYFSRNGTIYTGSVDKLQPVSVRCVLQRTKASPLFTVVYGGAGGSGASVKDLKIPQDIVDACIFEHKDCKMEKYYWVNGVKDAKYAGNQKRAILGIRAFGTTPDADNGQDCIVYLKDSNGNILWGYRVEGGKGGKGSAFNAPGKKEDAIAGEGGKGGKLCWKYAVSTSSWGEPFNCEDEIDGQGFSGEDAEKGEVVYKTKDSRFAEMIRVNVPRYDSFVYDGGYQTYTQAQASPKFDFIYRGGAGAGGGGGAFAHIIDIPIQPNKEYTVMIGSGGSIGKKGGDTKITLDDNTIIAVQGGGGGSNASAAKDSAIGANGKKGTGGKFSATTDSDNIKTILTNKTKTITADGSDGTDGTHASDKNTAPSIGGSGGISGISAITKVFKNNVLCGGLLEDIVSGCSNGNNVNAVTPEQISKLHAPVKHIFIDNNYGSYGIGGGGGGVSYDNDTSTAGSGSVGQDGYIYFYWKK